MIEGIQELFFVGDSTIIYGSGTESATYSALLYYAIIPYF